jgi:hypothetical protein
MKKILLILTVFIGSLSIAKAQDDLPQDGVKRQEKIQALYIAFITERLQLTPDEAQKFWPVHTQFMNEIKAVNKDLPPLEKEQAKLNIKKRYQDSFTKILGTQKCDKFYGLENEFKQKLLDVMKKNRQNQPGGRLKPGFRNR